MPLVFLGGLILWLGWFGFNPGSVMGITGDKASLVAHITLTTNLAGMAEPRRQPPTSNNSRRR